MRNRHCIKRWEDEERNRGLEREVLGAAGKRERKRRRKEREHAANLNT